MAINPNKRWDKQKNNYAPTGTQWAINQGVEKTPAGYGAYLTPSAGVPVSPSAVYGGTYPVPGNAPLVNSPAANNGGTPVDYVQNVMTVSGSANIKTVTPLSGGAESTDTGTETKTEPTYAEKMKQAAYDKANVDYLAAVTDAENRYKMQTNPYGATAERMAASGLQNTGYAGYLTDRAYATKVDEVLAAKAQKSAAERAAETEYAAFLQSEAANKASVYGESGDFVGSANALMQAGSISPDEASSMILNGYKAQIDNNTIDIDRVDTEYANGKIDDATYTSLKKYWNDNAVIDSNFFTDAEGRSLTGASAKVALDNAKKWLSSEKAEELQAMYDQKYTPKTAKVTFNFDGSFFGLGGTNTPGEAGNNFSVKDANGQKYRVQYAGGKASDPLVIEAAKSMDNNTVFMLDDKIYIKQGGEVYPVEQRYWTYGESYGSLVRLFKNGYKKGKRRS